MDTGQVRLTITQAQWITVTLYHARQRGVVIAATARQTLQVFGKLTDEERSFLKERKDDALEYLAHEQWYAALTQTWADYAEFVQIAERAYVERGVTESDRERVRGYVVTLGAAFDQRDISAWRRALARARHLLPRELSSKAAQSAHAGQRWRPALRADAIPASGRREPHSENVSDKRVIVKPSAGATDDDAATTTTTRRRQIENTRRFDWKAGKTIDTREDDEQKVMPVEEVERSARDTDDESEPTEAEQNETRYRQSHTVRGGGWMASASNEAYEEQYQNKCRECGELTGNYIRIWCYKCLSERHGLVWLPSR